MLYVVLGLIVALLVARKKQMKLGKPMCAGIAVGVMLWLLLGGLIGRELVVVDVTVQQGNLSEPDIVTHEVHFDKKYYLIAHDLFAEKDHVDVFYREVLKCPV